MKLRNKKTGETYSMWHICIGGEEITSVKQFNDTFEDYEPKELKEPLIKDEKIRKCVKLWTELNGYGHSLMHAEGDNWGNNWCSFYELLDEEELLFRKHKCTNLQNKKVYTIDELCGEEQE